MNQISDILALAAQAVNQKVDAVLATVVHTEGSAYRRAGAMMLICDDGQAVGMISGGCLEPHIIKRAFWLTRHGANVQVYQTGEDTFRETGKDDTVNKDAGKHNSDTGKASVVHTVNNPLDDPLNQQSLYDSDDMGDDDMSNDDIALNFGLGCNGRVHVLFERLSSALPLLQVIRRVRQTQQPTDIATLIRYNGLECQTDNTISDNVVDNKFVDSNVANSNVKNSVNNAQKLQIGLRIDLAASLKQGQLVDLEGNKLEDSQAGNQVDNQADSQADNPLNRTDLIDPATETLLEQLTAIHSQHKDAHYAHNIVVKTEQTQWLVQHIKPQIRLLICGAGGDVVPLVTMAKMQDWHVTVIDSRAHYATRARFANADDVRCVTLQDSQTLLKLSRHAAVAVMSHSLIQDRARLAVLLQQPPTYLGQLGPKYRTERLISEIIALVDNPNSLEEGITQLHYPIGLKLGGDGPEALALGIMAQMSAVMQGLKSD